MMTSTLQLLKFWRGFMCTVQNCILRWLRGLSSFITVGKCRGLLKTLVQCWCGTLTCLLSARWRCGCSVWPLRREDGLLEVDSGGLETYGSPLQHYSRSFRQETRGVLELYKCEIDIWWTVHHSESQWLPGHLLPSLFKPGGPRVPAAGDPGPVPDRTSLFPGLCGNQGGHKEVGVQHPTCSFWTCAILREDPKVHPVFSGVWVPARPPLLLQLSALRWRHPPPVYEVACDCVLWVHFRGLQTKTRPYASE